MKYKLYQKLLAGGMSAAAAMSAAFLIVPWEGEVKDKQGNHIVYLDAVGIPTVCWGQTGKDLYGNPIRMGMKYSDEECVLMLEKTIISFERQIDGITKVDFRSDYQKAALVSFTYNVGFGSYSTSTLLKKLQNGQHDLACEQLSRWVYAQKKKLNGLVSRRADEKKWCMGELPYDTQERIRIITEMVRATTPK